MDLGKNLNFKYPQRIETTQRMKKILYPLRCFYPLGKFVV